MPVNKRDVVRIVKAGASGTEKDALLALAGEKPGLCDGVEEDDVLGVLKQASATTGYNTVQPCQEMQSFWQALSAAESQQVGGARFLTMTSSGFPGEEDTTKKALLVRTCYEHLAAIVEAHFAGGGKIFILSGNPGIGKSLFSFYVMWLLAKQAQTVVWERRHAAYARVLFSPQGVFSGNVDSFNDALQKSLTWYMVDGKTPTRQNAKTILVSSPDHKIINEPLMG